MKRISMQRNEAGHAVLYGVIALVVVVAAVGFAAWRIHKKHMAPAPTATTTTTSGTAATTGSAVSAPLASGTDNTSLQGDLSNVNSSLSQQTTDQNNASGTLNDQQSEITVPTN